MSSGEGRGVADLRAALTDPDPRRFRMTAAAAGHVATFHDVTGLVLAACALPAATLTWGQPLRDKALRRRAA